MHARLQPQKTLVASHNRPYISLRRARVAGPIEADAMSGWVTRLLLLGDRLFWKITDFMLPPSCVCCGQSGSTFCADCHFSVQLLPSPLCGQCSYPLQRGKRESCDICRRYSLRLDRLVSVAFHQGALQRAIHSFKYQRNRALAHSLGEMVLQALPADLPPQTLLAPVPLSDEQLRERGFNQAGILANYVGRSLDIPVETSTLRRVRDSKTQVGLNMAERRQNVADAFRTEANVFSRRSVVLVDNVCTTGATLVACAEALRAAGVTQVWTVTLARAARR